MCFGFGGCGLDRVDGVVLKMEEGDLVVFYALVDMGFAEEADLFAGDVSKGVVELSDAAESQPMKTAQAR